MAVVLVLLAILVLILGPGTTEMNPSVPVGIEKQPAVSEPAVSAPKVGAKPASSVPITIDLGDGTFRNDRCN